MDEKTWNNIIASFPEPHILQTWQWAQVKSEVGWKPIYKTWGNEGEPDAAALILQRTVSLGGFAARLRVLYIPKGPLLRDWNDANLRKQVLDDLDRITREMGAIFIKMDPDVPLGTGIPGQENERENPIGTAVLGELVAGMIISVNTCPYSASLHPAGKGILIVLPLPSPAPVSLVLPVPG